MNILKLHLFVLLGAALAFTGCTRAKKENSSSFSISLSDIQNMRKASTLATGTLAHVVVNVSKNGAIIKADNWDSCRHCATPTTFTNFSYEFDSSSEEYLIQILAVFEETGGGNTFYYGSQKKALKEATENIEIELTALGGAEPLKEGRLVGRYLDNANSGPTGDLVIKFSANNSPSMELMRTPIVNGWFNAFILGNSTTRFSYEIDGRQLFSGVNLDSSVFAASPSVARVHIPPHETERSGSNNTSVWKAESGESYVVGWFGPGISASKKVCYPSTAADISGMKLNSTQAPLLRWNPASTLTTEVYVRGGVSYAGALPTTGECAAANHLVDVMHFSSTRIQNARDGIVGFTPPFKLQTIGTAPYAYEGVVKSSLSGSTLTIDLKLLPGVTSSLFDKFVIYKYTGAADYSDSGDSTPCGPLSRNEIPGFAKLSEPGLSSGENFSFQVPVVMTNNVPDFKALALCPQKGSVIYNSGTVIRKDHIDAFYSSGSGSNTISTPATQIIISKSYPRNTYTAACTSFTAYLADASGVRTSTALTAPLTFKIKKDGVVLSHYSGTDGGCSGTPTPTSTVTFPTGQTEIQFNLNLYSYGSAIALTPEYVSPPSGFTTPAVANLNYRDPMNTSHIKMSASGPSHIAPNECAPFLVQVKDYADKVVTPGSTLNILMVNSAPNSLKIFSDSACTGTEVPGAISFVPSVKAERMYYAKILSSSSTSTAELKFHQTTPAIDEGVILFSTLQTSGTTLAMNGFSVSGADFRENECQAFFIQPFHENGNIKMPVVAQSNLSVNLTVTGGGAGTLSENSACTPALSGPVSIAAGKSVKLMYFKPTSSSNGSFQMSATPHNSTKPYSVTAAVATKIALEIFDTQLKEGYVCLPLFVTPKDDNNNARRLATARTIGLTATSGTFHNTLDCSGTALTSPAQITDFREQTIIYYKTPSTIVSDVTFSLSYTGPGLQIEVPPPLTETFESSWTSVEVLKMAEMYKDSCHPIVVKLKNGNASIPYISSSMDVTLPSTTGLQFFGSSDPFCIDSPISSTEFLTGVAAKTIYVKSTLAQTYAAQTFTASGPTTATSNLTFLDPGSPIELAMTMMDTPAYIRGTCWPIDVQVKSARGLLTQVGSTAPWSLQTNSTANAHYFNSLNDCAVSHWYAGATNPITSVSPASSDTHKTIYYREYGSAAPILSASRSGLTSQPRDLDGQSAPHNFSGLTVDVDGAYANAYFGRCTEVALINSSITNAAIPFRLVTRVSGTPTVMIYDDTDVTCAGSPVSSKDYVFPKGQMEKIVRIKTLGPISPDTESVQFNMEATGTGIITPTFPFEKIKAVFVDTYVNSTCYPVTVIFKDISLTEDLDESQFPPLDVTIASDHSDLQFYTDSGCTTGATMSTATSITNGNTPIYMKASAAGTRTITVTPAGTNNSNKILTTHTTPGLIF